RTVVDGGPVEEREHRIRAFDAGPVFREDPLGRDVYAGRELVLVRNEHIESVSTQDRGALIDERAFVRREERPRKVDPHGRAGQRRRRRKSPPRSASSASGSSSMPAADCSHGSTAASASSSGSSSSMRPSSGTASMTVSSPSSASVSSAGPSAGGPAAHGDVS